MGNSRYDAGLTASYAASTATRTVKDYTARTINAKFDPVTIKVRESRKSDLNPNPTPIIVGLDVSGSMGRVVEAMRRGLGTLFAQIIERDPVSDPHVLAMAIGDMDFDSSPVQATQFEADPVTIGKQIEDLYLEQGGGGNNHESYLGPLYFACMRTACDAFSDGRKGFIFTVGDEEPQEVLTAAHMKRFFGDGDKSDITAEALIEMVSKDWNYFHLMVEQGDYMSGRRDRVIKAWTKLIGQRAIPLADYTKMSEVIISTIEVVGGKDKDEVVKSWKGPTEGVVARAIEGLE